MTAILTDNGVRHQAAALESVLAELIAIRGDMVAAPTMPPQQLDRIHPNFRDSARNFLHYLALRQHDIGSHASVSKLPPNEAYDGDQ